LGSSPMLDPREEGHPLGHALGRMMGVPREDDGHAKGRCGHSLGHVPGRMMGVPREDGRCV